MLERLVKLILANIAQGLDLHASTGTYANLFTTADTLRHSCFLDTLFNSRNLSNIGRQERAQRLKRRLYKVSQHISAISDLIKKAKRFLPIPYRWVTDTITDTGEGVFDLCCDVHDALSRGLDQSSLSPEIVLEIDKHFPSLRSNWANHSARMHSR